MFYVHPSGTFKCGADLASDCTYLEAAPTTGTNAWTDATYAWSGNISTSLGEPGQRTAIGTGYANTTAIVNQGGGGDTADRAATASRAYRGPNNLSDWYLPSQDELNEMCKYARQRATGVTSVICSSAGTLRSDFASAWYWSSTEYASTHAWPQDMASGYRDDDSRKETALRVRPIRAF